ncbi:uncharacterized protein LOC105157414 [Sesamum indicum]|uniref:Uncharacterized protein LOC105157414 n=1 Tax=Sesamum indicum TaxID=4182 RepID=A0A6I9SX19_SESIN|nr:uncharacterized protein LOC105157414 [Sesamum indicum]
MKIDVQEWVKGCETCQRAKHENHPYPGLLQTLPVLDQAWSCVSMDFIKDYRTLRKSKKWAHWLTLAELWFNTNYHTGLKATPFQTLYGYPPQQLPIGPYLQSHHTDVVELVQERTKRMKLYAERKRTEREFHVGDEVFLKLQLYKQTSVALRKQLKLSAKYFGPYKVIERIGHVAYKLELPTGSKIHPVFHFPLLKKKIGSKYFPSVNLSELEDEVFKVYPIEILGRRLVPRNNVGVPQVLIQWAHSNPEQATWEDYYVVAAKFPRFDPWGQGTKKGGRDVVFQGGTRF